MNEYEVVTDIGVMNILAVNEADAEVIVTARLMEGRIGSITLIGRYTVPHDLSSGTSEA